MPRPPICLGYENSLAVAVQALWVTTQMLLASYCLRGKTREGWLRPLSFVELACEPYQGVQWAAVAPHGG